MAKTSTKTAAAARNYLCLIAGAVSERAKEVRDQDLNDISQTTAENLGSLTDEIGEMAVKTLGISRAEADRLKAQANAMAGLEGQPALMLASM